MLANLILFLALPCLAGQPLPSTSTRAVDANMLDIYRQLKAESIRHGRPIGSNVVFSSSVRVDGDTYIDDTLKVSGTITGLGLGVYTSSVTASAFQHTCPTAFTSVTAAGRQLGCIQSAEEGSDSWWNAQADCFGTYGGRLPLFVEWYTGMANYSLTDEADDSEWTGDVDPITPAAPIVGNGGITTIGRDAHANSHAYRCWIPR